MMEPAKTPQIFSAEDLSYPTRPELGAERTAELLNTVTDQSREDRERIDALCELIGFAAGEVRATFPEINFYSRNIDMTREISESIRVEMDPFGGSHAHAVTTYGTLTAETYFNAIGNIFEAAERCNSEINFHIPNEILFESQRDLRAGEHFMSFVDAVANRISMPVVWENAVRLQLPEYSLLENQSIIPRGRDLCLDIGHLMLGSASQEEALQRIDQFEFSYHDRIKHLHLHINDLVHDQHNNDPLAVIEFLGEERFKRLTEGRTFIFEQGVVPDEVKSK